MRHQHDAPVQNGRATLVDRSVAGDEEAFAELFEQHAGLGWRYAYALTGTARDAVEVTTEGFGRAFTTLRGDLGMPQEFRPLLLSTTRNAAVDRRDAQGDDVPAFETSEDMLALATAFTALPERWRSALWLSEVEGEGPRSVASILGLEDLDAAKVTARARKGLREQFLRADAAATPGRNCERAIRRLGPYVAGTLPANQTGKLERHLRLCTTCADRNQAMVGLIDRLPLLVPAVPALLEDDVRLAWAAAVATPSTGLGITAFAEKLLAGVAALSAGVGVLGAAIVSVGSGGDDEAVAPIAPIVTELAAPRPDDLDLTIDLDPAGFEGSDASSEARFGDIRAASGDGSSAPVTAGLDAPPGTSGGSTPPASGGVVTPTPSDPGIDPDDGTGDAPAATTAPMVSVGTTLGDVPVAIEVGGSIGVTVGSINLGSGPQPGTDTVAVDGPLAPLSPVVQPVDDVLNGLLGG